MTMFYIVFRRYIVYSDEKEANSFKMWILPKTHKAFINILTFKILKKLQKNVLTFTQRNGLS